MIRLRINLEKECITFSRKYPVGQSLFSAKVGFRVRVCCITTER